MATGKRVWDLGINAKAYFYPYDVATSPEDPVDLDFTQHFIVTTGDDTAELKNVKDVSCSFSVANTDITTRASRGWRGKASTLKEASVSFKMRWSGSDAGYAALRNSWLHSTMIGLGFLTGAHDIETADSEGPIGYWVVTDFSRDENLEEAIMINVTVELAQFGYWFGE